MIVRDPYQRASGAPMPTGCWRNVAREMCGADPVSDVGLCQEHLDGLRGAA